jgi:hypothetical protein
MRQTCDYLKTRAQAAATRNFVPVSQPFEKTYRRIWRTDRKMAARLAKTIRRSPQIEAAQDWQTIANFKDAIIPDEARGLTQARKITPRVWCNILPRKRFFVVCSSQEDKRRATYRS